MNLLIAWLPFSHVLMYKNAHSCTMYMYIQCTSVLNLYHAIRLDLEPQQH
jgi:hypothetical protein